MNVKVRRMIALLGIVGLVIGRVAAQPQPATGLTLRQCIEYARQNSPAVRQARIGEQIASVQVQQFIGQNLPQLSAGGTLDDYLKIPVQLLPASLGRLGGAGGTGTTPGSAAGGSTDDFIPVQFGTKYRLNANIRLEQKLFDPSFGLGLKASKLTTRLRATQTAQQEQQQAVNVANAYYQTLVLELQRRLTQEDLNSSDTLLRQEQVRLRNGTSRSIDVRRIQLDRNNLVSQLEQQSRNYSQALNELKYQMGMPLSQPLALVPIDIERELKAQDLLPPVEGFFNNRPDLQQLRINTQLQELNRKSNNRGYFPSLSAYGSVGTTAQRQEFDFLRRGTPYFGSTYIGVSANWLIFDGGQRLFRDRENRLNLESLRVQEAQTRESAQLQLSNAQVNYQNLLTEVRREQDNIALAEEILRVTELEYREGIATSVDLINSKQSLTQARNNYANKLIQLYQARIDYENSQGTILEYVTKY